MREMRLSVLRDSLRKFFEGPSIVTRMPGQPFHYTGTDFLEERDGRVSRLYMFIDQNLFQP
jgi:hypothetical protein